MVDRKKNFDRFFSWAGHFFFGLAASPLGLAEPYEADTSCHGHAYVMDVTSHYPRAVEMTAITHP